MQNFHQKSCITKHECLLSKIHANTCVQVSSTKNEVFFSPSYVFLSASAQC